MIDQKLKRLRELLREVDEIRDEIWAELQKERKDEHLRVPVVTSLNLDVARCHQHSWWRDMTGCFICLKCGVSGRL